MKSLIPILLILTACGGSNYQEVEQSEIDFLISFCEAQGKEPQLLQVYNVDTGESYLDVNCEKINQKDLCKVDNGRDQEC
jgi:hypothetical protein